jgi:chromosomal replication initiator protein
MLTFLQNTLKMNYTQEELQEKIISATCIYFNISRDRLFSTRRFREITKPRSICQYLLLTEADMTLAAVGRLMNKKEHTSVIHNRNAVRDQLSLKHTNEYQTHINNIMKLV